MKENILGLGIDHGFGNIKTKHSVFTSGVKRYEKEPEVTKRVVGFENVYYAVGGSRMEVKDNKTQDDDYYILTLAGIAEELKTYGITKAKISIGAGLPLTRVGAEKQEFKDYLFKNQNVQFSYEGIPYEVTILDVEIYPQGYAAILPYLHTCPSPCLVMEWGSWTVEVIYMEERTPVLDRCLSLPYGTIRCMREINKELMRRYNVQAEESGIEKIMLGEDIIMQEKYQQVVKAGIHEYLNKVMQGMKESGFSLQMIPVIHLGGGASVVKRFGEYDPQMTRIIEGVAVNATAYEQLIRRKLSENEN